MDQPTPSGNGGFAGNALYGDSHQHINSFELPYTNGVDPSFDASWGINASEYPQHNPTPSWAQTQNANPYHLSTTPNTLNGYVRSLSHSPAPYAQNHFNNYGGQQQNFQYRQPQYDPALVTPSTLNQATPYSSTSFPTTSAGTIAPHALQNAPTYSRSQYDNPSYSVNNTRPARPSSTDFVNQQTLINAIPKGQDAGRFVIVGHDDMARSTKSERMGNFVNIGTEALEWDVNRAAAPQFTPRSSRNELRKIAGTNAQVLRKLNKKIVRQEKPSITAPKAASRPTAPGQLAPVEKIRYEGETSSEEESSSEDDDSMYSSDEATESAPLPMKRPESPKQATEYDTIKALWRTKRKTPNAETIRKGLVDFWEIAKTIRDRWKADATAVSEAETKRRENELPLLRSRVKDQRDMMEVAFKAALKHGHRDIVGLFSQNQPLMYLCYQFLLDRSKEDDHNGPLARAILETISLSTSLTQETFDKTHLVKVVPRYVKRGDGKTQFYAKKIISKASSSPEKAVADSKKPAPKDGAAASPPAKQAEPVAGIKRSASTAGDSDVRKKVATSAGKLNGSASTSKLDATKKTSASDAGKSNATLAPAVKAKQVTAKPSGLFASLQSAAKKPGTSNASRAASAAGASTATTKPGITQTSAPKSTFSFTETMANLSKPKEEKVAPKPAQQMPQETPAERAKRLRKESRRHLRVSFKRAEELVEVRVFDHFPEEDDGHDASQVRDVTDVGGEGRMFKQQHQMMDIDDEDEAVEEMKLVAFKEPTAVDFNEIDKQQRETNYARFGGDLPPDSAEKAKREYYEANNLMVFYSDPSDIPPNPREPSDPYNGDPVESVTSIAPPEEKYRVRGEAKKAALSQHGSGLPQPAAATGPPAGFDLSRLQQYTQPPAQQAPVPPHLAINELLAQLTRANPAQTATPPQPQMAGLQLPQQFQPPMPAMAPQPPAAGTPQIDLSAILRQIAPGGAPAPAMNGFGYNAAAPAPNMMGYQPPAQQAGAYEDPERKQWREGTSGGRDGKRSGSGPNPYYKTKVCKYWQEGRCQKGDSCTYKHSED